MRVCVCACVCVCVCERERERERISLNIWNDCISEASDHGLACCLLGVSILTCEAELRASGWKAGSWARVHLQVPGWPIAPALLVVSSEKQTASCLLPQWTIYSKRTNPVADQRMSSFCGSFCCPRSGVPWSATIHLT